MFDFNKYIDLLNKNGKYSITYAIDLVKDQFHIGKIEIKSKGSKDVKEFVVGEYVKPKLLSYTSNDCEYRFFKRKDDYQFNDQELSDISLFLKLLSIFNVNYELFKKASEAEMISYNTKLYNAYGYCKKVFSMQAFIDPTQYNAYYINLKGFSLVNKQFGSETANHAIVAYGKLIKEFLSADEVCGHLGGDNYVAFVKRERHQSFIDLLTDATVEVGMDIENNALVHLIGVVGYCEITKRPVTEANIISNPSTACQYARSSKKLVVQMTNELLEMINSVKNIESTFNQELEQGNFIVYYQPKFDIITGKIIGVEALSRWLNNGHLVPPGVFVPILEKNGEIVKLDLYVLENLCKDIHNYRNMGHKIVPASCNLSRRDFVLDDLEEKVINIIKKYNVKTEDIVIEVTETTNVEEKERLARFIENMHKNGIMTSIDDFGTGYSSLSVLRDFKVNEIKIDRSFINREVLIDSDDIIIGSIINMAKRLNINVICEGVETQKQADFLLRHGCNKAQGYLYSKPLPKLEFEAMLQRIGTNKD